jgi:hypothetical protein
MGREKVWHWATRSRRCCSWRLSGDKKYLNRPASALLRDNIEIRAETGWTGRPQFGEVCLLTVLHSIGAGSDARGFWDSALTGAMLMSRGELFDWITE